jgi:hypothetical protein
MSNARRNDVIGTKKEGERWFALRFPEQYHVWDVRTGWDPEFLKKYPVRIETISFIAVPPKAKWNGERYGKRNPYPLAPGCDVVRGYILTKITKSAGITLKPDTLVDLNRAMKEISNEHGIKQWVVSKLFIYNPNAGVIVEFKRHNPNKTVIGLYTYRFYLDNVAHYYSNVPEAAQRKVTAGICDEKVICKLHTVKTVKREPGCGGHPLTPNPVKVNRKMVTLHLQ